MIVCLISETFRNNATSHGFNFCCETVLEEQVSFHCRMRYQTLRMDVYLISFLYCGESVFCYLCVFFWRCRLNDHLFDERGFQEWNNATTHGCNLCICGGLLELFFSSSRFWLEIIDIL